MRSWSCTRLILRDPEVWSVGIARYRAEKAHSMSQISQLQGLFGLLPLRLESRERYPDGSQTSVDLIDGISRRKRRDPVLFLF
jgi:hypothetical protein